MRHNHGGYYGSRTPKGRYTYKHNPEHHHRVTKKEMDYEQLKRRYNIRKRADDDGDGVPNYKDCRPWDKHRQDLIDGDIPDHDSEEGKKQFEEDLAKHSEEKNLRLNMPGYADKEEIENLTQDIIEDRTAKATRGERYWEEE